MSQPNLQITFERRFILAEMPTPLTRASEHLQFFDNYLTETRLLLRQIRVPKTKEWMRQLIQKYAVAPPNFLRVATAEITLSEYEYEVLSVFEGNELRYNRYFLRLESGETLFVDMFLNRELWNLILATIEFATEDAAQTFVAPSFVAKEVTQDEFFANSKLVGKNIDEVRQKLNSSA